MRFLTRLLTAPISAPLSAAMWIAAKIGEAAEAEFYDPVRIQRALGELEADLEAGRIDEATYEAAEDILLGRLQQGRSLRDGV